MDPKTLSDYELRRLETIRRNNQMLGSLVPENLRLASPQNAPKRPWNRRPPPSVLRRSLRHRGIPPPSDPPHPVPRLNAISTSSSDEVADSAKVIPTSLKNNPNKRSTVFRSGVLKNLVLGFENEKKVGVGNAPIYSLRFLPLGDRKVIVAGNGIGSLGFWDVDSSLSSDDGEGINLYQPHSNQVSGISVHPCSSRKIFTSSTDGSIMLMDIEKETFDMLLSSEHPFYSICQCPQDNNSLFIGEGAGLLKFWDEREGKASVLWKLHGDRINTVDINPENPNLMATSSTDGLCCIWDLRNMKKESPENMKSFGDHQGAVHSAYFSPSGKYLVTTSAVGGRVGIISGGNFDDLSIILQTNQTCKLPAPLRAIWGWDDSYIFVGNKNKAINVISMREKTVTMLQSLYMTSVLCRFAAHNHLNMVGYLAGATAVGRIYLWKKE